MKKRLICIVLTVFFLCPLFSAVSFADDVVNLAKNQTCIVESGEIIEFSYGLMTEDGMPFEVNNGRLTDENIATADASSKAWYRAYRGGNRVVRFDFGDCVSISAVSGGFLFDSSRNIYPPRYIKVYLSDDGVDYGLAAEYNAEFPLSYESPDRCELRVDFEKSFSARYVNVVYSCDNYVYCDEISVFGSETLSGLEEKVEIINSEPKVPEFPSDISGMSNIVRLQAGGFTKSDSMSCVGYLNSNREISGLMFDSVCLSPNGNYDFSAIKDWDAYFHDLEISLDMLETSAQEVYSHLNYNGDFGIFITLPYPKINNGEFGDINQDGIPEKCESLEERIQILKWFLDKCALYFNQEVFENISVKGFFWGCEEIDFNGSDHEEALIKNTNRLIAEKGLCSVFEYNYLGGGYDQWQKLGFDCGIMQSDYGYSVSQSDHYFKSEMLLDFAESVKRHNMGVSVELDKTYSFGSDGFWKAGNNYETQLYYGYKTGYLNGVTSFCGYDGIFDYFCSGDINTPKGIYLRRLYDLTYNFIRGTYENLAPQLNLQTNHEMHFCDNGITIDIEIIDGDSYWGDIDVEFPTLPSNGSVVASSNNKELIYNVDEGFSGEDSFSVRVTDGFGYSSEVVVTISVTPPEIVVPPSSEESKDDSSDEVVSENSVSEDMSDVSNQDSDVEKSSNFWVYGVVALIAGTVLVVFIGILIKKRK